MLKQLATFDAAVAAFVDEQRKLIWVAQGDGTLRQIPFSGRESAAAASGPAVTGMAGTPKMLVFAHGDGSISALDPGNPRARRRILARSKSSYGQAGVTGSPEPTVAVVTQSGPTSRPLSPAFTLRAPASLTLVRSSDGTSSTIAIAGLTGVAVDGKSVFVARNGGSRGHGEIGLLRGETVKPLAADLPPAGRLGLADKGRLLLLAHPASGRISAVRPATGAVDTRSAGGIRGKLVEAHGLADGRIAILTTDLLVLIDSLADLSRDPRIDPISDPIFVGSWTELGFDLGTSGLTKDQVHFDVPDGTQAGFVSYTRQNEGGDPVPLLVVGGRIGVHKVRLLKTAGNVELASASFEITDHWRDSDRGPPGYYATNSRFGGDSGWGGGPGTPQNMSTEPHNGTWRSLVLMVDTDSARWPTANATMTANRDAILDHVANGFTVGADSRSARHYYEENSQFVAGTGGSADRGLTVSVKNGATFGPVGLPDDWGDYFAQDTDDEGNVTDTKWWSKGATLQTIISRAISDGVATTADFTDIDVLLVVPFSPDAGGGGDRFVWPHANSAEEFLCGNDAATDRRSFAWTFVPLDFFEQNGRHMHTTLSHELGHTLGLPDLYDFEVYSDDVTNRITGGWDMMAGSRNDLPHYSISNKMRMGWIPADHLKLYNFQGSNAAAETITLHAAELGDPSAGRFKAIEIRLGDGWNYYVEYRAKQSTQVSDVLPTDRRVLITDVTSETFAAPIARPPILLVHNDVDGDGPIIGTGGDLEEKDPGTQMDLKIEVVSTAADNAVVKVSYGANGKPEPGIRPWTGAPNWQSPDIEVRNDRADADPGTYFNTPWLGHDNKVIAKVRNSGDLLAKGVAVDFFVTEYTTGDGPWASLGTDTRDVGPGATVEFSAPWNPSSAEDRHYCVIVRIKLYQDPGNLAVVDQNIYNNEARSNYTQFISASASPSTRVGAEVLLANPFSRSTLVFADVKKSHPQHRVFTDHRWLRVPGKGQLPIRVWDEAMWGTAEWELVARKEDKRQPTLLWKVPNRLSLSGWARRPFKADCGALTLTGGVGLRVDAGRATKVRVRQAKKQETSGQILFVDNGKAVTAGGKLLFELSDGQGKSVVVHGKIDSEGSFAAKFGGVLGDKAKTVQIHYLGAVSAAPCKSGTIKL